MMFTRLLFKVHCLLSGLTGPGSSQLGSLSPSVRQTGAPMFEQASLWVSFSNKSQLWITELTKSPMHQAIFNCGFRAIYNRNIYCFITFKLKVIP